MPKSRGAVRIELEDGTTVSLQSVLSALPEALEGDRSDEVRGSLEALAQSLQHLGMSAAALQLVEQLRNASSSAPLDDIREAWLLNTEGLSLSDLGRDQEATERFETMRSIGEARGDAGIESTALQNLASMALKTSRYAEARELGLRSLRIKVGHGDDYGAAQVLLNLASIDIEEGQWKRASRVLTSLEQGLRRLRAWGLLASVEISRARIAVAVADWPTAETRYRAALALARRVGESHKELVILLNLGHVKLDEGDPLRGMRWLRSARVVSSRLELPTRELEVEELFALALHAAGRDVECVEAFRRARRLAERIGDSHAWARITANMGAVSLNLGRRSPAARYLTSAERAFQEIGDAGWESRVILNRAVLARARGRPTMARELLERSLGLAPEQDHDDRADILRAIAETWVLNREMAAQATPYFWNEISEASHTQSKASLSWRALTAARLLAQAGANESSLDLYEFAAKGYSRLREKQWVFHARNDRAIALSDLGRHGEARRTLNLCLKMALQLSDRAMEQRATANLGELSRRQGRLSEAVTLLSLAISLARNQLNREAESEALANLGIALTQMGRFEKATEAFENSLAIASARGMRGVRASALGGLGGIAVARGESQKAIAMYRKAAALNRSLNDAHYIEDLAGLLEALAITRRVTVIETEVQRLVTESQRLSEEPTAAIGICRAARWLLRRGEPEAATDLYAAAIVLAGAGYSRNPAPTSEGLAHALIAPITYAAVHLHEEMPEQEEELTRSLVEVLDTRYGGVGSRMSELFAVARSVAREGSSG